MSNVVCMGELLIDFIATESGVSVGEASAFEKAPGGAPANVAVAVRRLGLSSAFITQVGDDPFGRDLVAVLAREGVETSGIRFSQTARTMLAFVALRADGERSFVFYRHPSADMLLTAADVAYEAIEQCDLFHFGSITLIDDPVREATLQAAQQARNHAKLISYDPNLRLKLWRNADEAHSGMRLGLNYAHILKVSDEEIDTLLKTGESITDLWQQFEQLQLVMLTRGAQGCTLYTRAGDQYHHDGYRVKAVDTTGAGDTFMAATIVYLLEQLGTERDFDQLDYPQLLIFANAAAALTTTARGAIPALPTRSQIDGFLASMP